MTTDTLTLAAFLLARIAEDERRIDEYGDNWAQGDKVYAAGRNPDLNSPWGPSRLLAECEAKRRIVELHTPEPWEEWEAENAGRGIWDSHQCPACGWKGREWPCPTLKLLALPYADHPDFREEWRP